MTAYISCEQAQLTQQCQQLMSQFDLVYSETFLPRLHLGKMGLCLLDNDGKAIVLDWNDAQWKQRAKGARGQDPLVKVSLAGSGSRILDITAGWGRDAMVMAQAGGRLTLLEKNPLMAAMLFVAHQSLLDLTLKTNIECVWANAHDYLIQITEKPDVIYIDPMHPERQKSALVKKHLQVLQQLVSPNEDVLELITCSLQHALKRVVLKWPEKQAPLCKPSYSVHGKTIRFDVYLVS